MAYTDTFTVGSDVYLENHSPWAYSSAATAAYILAVQDYVTASGASAVFLYYYNQTAASKHYAKLKYLAGSLIGPAIRVSTSDDGYYCLMSAGDDKVYNGECVDGSFSDWDGGQVGVIANDVMELHVDASTETTIIYKVNGATVATYTSKSALSGGKYGLSLYASGATADDWEGGDVAGAAPQTVILDTAVATATPISLANVNAPVSRTLDTAVSTATAIALTVSAPPPAVTIILDTASIAAAGVGLAVDAPVTRVLDSAALTANGIGLSVDAPITRTMGTAQATATAIAITISAPAVGVTVTLSAASLTVVGIPSTVDAPITIVLDTASLTATGIGVTLDLPEFTVQDVVLYYSARVVLDTITLTGTPIPLVVVEQQYINLSTASLMATPVALSIDAPITIVLDTAQLTTTGIGLAVSAVPPGQSVTLSTAIMTATGIALDVVPGEALTGLDTAALAATGIPISVFIPTGIYILLETG